MSGRDKFLAQLEELGIDVERTSFRSDAPTVVYGLRYRNLDGRSLEFSVEHKNRLMLENDLLRLPEALIPREKYEPSLVGVEWNEGKQCAVHYQFEDWLRLMALQMPGTWYYLGVPAAYEEARLVYT